MLSYPLELSYKNFSPVTRMQVVDAKDQRVAYLEKKLFDVSEDVTVYADKDRQHPLFHIKEEELVGADATYKLSAPDKQFMSTIKNKGIKSFWKSTYEILDEKGEQIGTIYQENPWVALANGLISSPLDWLPIPFFDNVSESLDGLLFSPVYIVSLGDRPVMRLKKLRSLLKGKFHLEKLVDLNDSEENTLFFGIVTTVLLERSNE